jgi:hypothetical protein
VPFPLVGAKARPRNPPRAGDALTCSQQEPRVPWTSDAAYETQLSLSDLSPPFFISFSSVHRSSQGYITVSRQIQTIVEIYNLWSSSMVDSNYFIV